MVDGEPQRGQFDESKLSSPEVRAVTKTMFNIVQLEQVLTFAFHAHYDQQDGALNQVVNTVTDIVKRLQQNVYVLESAYAKSGDNEDLQTLLELEKIILKKFLANMAWATNETILSRLTNTFNQDGVVNYFHQSFKDIRQLLDEFGKNALVKQTKNELTRIGLHNYSELPHYRGTLPINEE